MATWTTATGSSATSAKGSEGRCAEILEHAEHVDLPGLDKNKVIELKLDGTKEAELYRMLLDRPVQCPALGHAVPV